MHDSLDPPQDRKLAPSKIELVGVGVGEQGILPPRGHLTMSADILLSQLRGEGATGIEWVEVRDVAKHPRMHRAAPKTEKDGAPIVSSGDW